LLSLICPWHCSHRGTETGVACLSCPLKLQTYIWGSMPGASGSPASEMRTSADSSQPERARLESCCSASSAHGTARTEAQRLGLLPCLAHSNFKRMLGGPHRAPPAALLRKCERLQIARMQKELAWKAVAQPHLPMALLAQRHRDWGCLLVLPFKLQTYIWGSVPDATGSPALNKRVSADSSQPERASLKSVAQPHVAMALLAQRHRDWGCLLVLPPQNSNVS